MTPNLLAVAIAGTAILAGPAMAQPVGIPECDAFLTAYERCAASPGVPDAARAPIAQGISGMRTSFRDSLASGGDRARRSLVAQCTQYHTVIRESLIKSFKCDFPAGAVGGAGAGAVGAVPGSAPPATRPAATPDPAAQALAKANAFTRVQNALVDSHPMSKDLAEYNRNNERVLRLGTKLGGNAFFLFGITAFDDVVDLLQAALALPGSVPEVEPAAARLLTALTDLNPVVKALDRYQTTREFRQDEYKFAREQSPVFVARMKAAIGAADAYETALFDRAMARDLARVEALPKGSLAQRLLATSLNARGVLRQFEALEPGADTAPFTAALMELSNSNKTLSSSLDAMAPKPDSSCKNYGESIASMIGHGRDVARDIKARDNPDQAASQFGSYYNRSVEDLSKCQRSEERSRS